MPDSSQEKTEQATPKKRRDERKKGNVFSSKDLVSAFFILLMFFTMRLMSSLMVKVISDSMTYWLDLCSGNIPITPVYTRTVFLEVVRAFCLTAGPPLIVGILVNVLFTGAQTRFVFSGEALKFKLSRMNPLEGIKKMFSLKALVELVKNLLKIAVIAAIIYNEIIDRLPEIARLLDVDVKAGMAYLAGAIYSTIMTIGAVFLGVGVADLLYQWYQFEKDMRMTKQEIKEEYKQMEGDPQIKGRIKQKQREMSQQRMMQEVPTADVIIRNPTHYAVAIRYNPDKNNAPVVVAKGAGYVALHIIGCAEDNDVTMVENKPLARALYEKVELDREIPPDFYSAVAEILAFVYNLKNKKPVF